jgi:flagellar motor switch protein FliG
MIFWMLFLVTLPTMAAPNSNIALSPEALSAKSFLEDVLARRYSQELATKVDRGAFTLGATLDLTEVVKKVTPPPPAQPSEPMSDLMLGTLDPEELIKKVTTTEERQNLVQGFLSKYRIKAVTVAVGLREDINPAVKADVTKWLTTRLKGEFGAIGKSTISDIKREEVKPPKDTVKTLWDWLDQFQSLAGQIVLALAILLGAVLWQLMGSKSSNESREVAGAPAQTSMAAGGQGASVEKEKEKLAEEELKQREQMRLKQEIDLYMSRLNELVPRLGPEFEGIIRYWSKTGDVGKLKIASLADAVGRTIGRLPIPVDAAQDTAKIFAKMAARSLNEKLESLQSIYWDILTAMNLGAQTLEQPFGYLGGINIGLVNQVLMDENPKMKTVVSLFLPDNLRAQYFESLSADNKLQLLETAVELTQIESSELKSLDGSLLKKLKPGAATNVIPLEMTLNKVIAALTPTEELIMLPKLQGAAIEEFKRSTASLAFLGEWPENKLGILFASCPSNEITALLRTRQDLAEKVLAQCPPLTAEMVSEELAQLDRTDASEKDHLIQQLSERLKQAVASQELKLKEIFPVANNGASDQPLAA